MTQGMCASPKLLTTSLTLLPVCVGLGGLISKHCAGGSSSDAGFRLRELPDAYGFLHIPMWEGSDLESGPVKERSKKIICI